MIFKLALDHGRDYFLERTPPIGGVFSFSAIQKPFQQEGLLLMLA